MLDALDDAAVPLLAALAGEFFQDGVPDRDPRYLRLAGRMLADSTASDIRAMRDLLAPLEDRLAARPDASWVGVQVNADAANSVSPAATFADRNSRRVTKRDFMVRLLSSRPACRALAARRRIGRRTLCRDWPED